MSARKARPYPAHRSAQRAAAESDVDRLVTKIAPTPTAPPPYLTDAEVAEICRPRKQGAAQIRYLTSLGIKVERRADGTPLVWRRDVEAPKGERDTVRASNEPTWKRPARV
jgi:hypothetical protein